jgi:hypothetical protein
MFLTEYPMVSRDQDGQLCGFEQDPAKAFPGVTTDEFDWAERAVWAPLIQTIHDQEKALGWTVVKGIADAFRPHGYCSDESWLIRPRDSFRAQVFPIGTAHPTLAGQEAYRDLIADFLTRAFYPESRGTVRGPARVDGRP